MIGLCCSNILIGLYAQYRLKIKNSFFLNFDWLRGGGGASAP